MASHPESAMTPHWHSLEQKVQAYKSAQGARILRDFAKWLALPNLADNFSDISTNAVYLQGEMASRGVEAEIWQLEGGTPVVYGELRTRGAVRTLLLYAHLDGQPANPEDWTVAPWTPSLFSEAIPNGGVRIPFPVDGDRIDPTWRIYARSASDDKAPFIAILTALDFLRDQGVPPGVNLKFFFDSEEEKGSPFLERYLAQYSHRLAADGLLICDGPVHQNGQPQLYFGARGFSGFTMTVYGPIRHLHSGHYGNWAPNPALMLTQLLASMKDENGRVLVGGFYDNVHPLHAVERAALDTIPQMDDMLREELALAQSEGAPASLNELLMRPSLNIRGLKSGVADGRIVNMIPDQAQASVDMRLVKGNTPAEMMQKVERHIGRQGYHIVRKDPDRSTRLRYPKIAKIVPDPGYPPVRTDMSLPLVQGIVDRVKHTIEPNTVLLPTLGGRCLCFILINT